MIVISETKRIKGLILFLSFFLLTVVAPAQRKMETLDRGLVAVKVNQGVFLSWRIYGTEWYGVTYNLYRDGAKINTAPLEVSNFTDPQGTVSSTYTVSAIEDGTEKAQCAPVTPLARQYKEIPLKERNTSIYEINDATAADLDGDGEYEIIVKRMCPDWSANATNFSYFEAYKMDGTLMWEINVGPNIMSSSGVEINIAAFDFDEDGKAEVFMRTSEGTIFGDGSEIGDTNNDGITNYRYSVLQTANMQYMTEGPEFLSLIDGETGAELDRVDFIPRHSAEWWGDGYGHRANKFFFGAPYLDGKHPSLFIGRGIYTKTVMRTYDIVDKKLQLRWEWSALDSSDPYYGQGNHNYTIADVDEDGRDEIVWGSMTVDDDGTGLYSTNLGHGDALHVGDLDPFRKGTEIFKCLENNPVFGTVFYDGATGEILIHHKIDRDCGRCIAANISDDVKGASLCGGGKMYEASTLKEVNMGWNSENFRIYWDGDLLEELLDKTGFTAEKGYGAGVIQKPGVGDIFVATGTESCNYTKGTPTLQADLFGDWREEVVWRNEANTAIRIYTTVDPTTYRIYTLMHDHQYRQAICWQMCGYNQPPHVSFFLGEGEGITVPPPPAISNNRLVYEGTGTWDKSSAVWNLDGTTTTYSDGQQVLFDPSAGTDVMVELAETVTPSVLTVNTPEDVTINADNGKLSGSMRLEKQGLGTLTLNGTHDYSGKTEVWNGSLNFDGELQNSPVSLGFFGELDASGRLSNGVTMRYASMLEIGNKEASATLRIVNGLTMEEGAQVAFDLYTPDSPENDSLFVDGGLALVNNTVFKIQPHLFDGESKLAAGDYLLMSVEGGIEGDLSTVLIDGISGTAANLKETDGKIYLEVIDVRSATTVEWNGAENDATWDLATTQNFLNEGVADVFVDQDNVIFNDNATSKKVNIVGEVTPASISVDASEDYTFNGSGKISGNATLTKSGTGTLYLKNSNDFTGKVTINNGIVLVNKMPTNQALGAIGAVNSDPAKLEINGGTLAILESGESDRAVYLGSNGGTIQNSSKLQWNEKISGGVLTKAGAGELIVAGKNNNNSKTILRSGTLNLLYDESSPGQTISLQGGTLQCNDNAYSYNTWSWNIEVPEGKSGTINVDSRGYYTGKLTGGGTLRINAPWWRTDFNGNMSEFEGTLECYSTHSVDVAQLRFNHSAGLPKALVIINPGLSVFNDNGSTLILGALAGNGTLDAGDNYQIGAKGIDTEFNGTIATGSLTKVGSGEFKLSAANTYNGNTTVSAGILNVNNTSGSATGSGNVTVNDGAILTGTGTVGGNLTVLSGGTLLPGKESTGYTLHVDKTLNLKSGSILSVKANPLFNYIDQLQVSGKIIINGELVVSNSTASEYKAGDEFKLFDCATIDGAFASISPEVPGENLEWDLSELLSDGLLKIKQATAVNSYAQAFSIYPNPVADYLTIQTKSLGEGTATLLINDLSGRTLIETQIENKRSNRIDVSKLVDGVYIVELRQDQQLANFRIIKH